MSYDLAVWDGERPPDDAHALATFLELMNALEAGYDDPPLPSIAGFVGALIDRWPDLTSDAATEHDSPWAEGPLIANAVGPIVFFALRPDRADEAAAFAASTAAAHDLVCFDPQLAATRRS